MGKKFFSVVSLVNKFESRRKEIEKFFLKEKIFDFNGGMS